MAVNARVALALLSLAVVVLDTTKPASAQLPPAYQTIVDQTWAASLARRQTVLTNVVNSGSVWPYGIQGQTMWALSALSLNRDVATANAKILASSTAADPYAFFDVYSYLKIATLFGQNSSFADTRGRITAQTEAAMKQVLWTDVSGTSLAMAALDRVWWVNDSENLDLNRNVTNYLAAAILKDDATYGTRLFTDGKKAVDHYNAWNAWYASWLKERATRGLLVEVGSDTYQKYSVAAITTLRDLSPDPVVRQRAGMMLDLFYIDEAQYSISDRRGGGKSRNDALASEFEGIGKMMYGEAGGAAHTKTFETSTYQVPAIAALIRSTEKLNGPIEVRTRLPGESQSPLPAGLPSGFYALAPASRLVNYEYRTPNYELGSMLQDGGVTYTNISSQNRWCGMIFDDLKAVYPEVAQAGGSLPRNAYWSYQNKSSLILQKMSKAEYTGTISILVSSGLTKREQDGWLFTSNGKAFLGVRVVSGSYTWTDATHITPANQSSPVIFQAGDVIDYASLDDFIAKTLSLNVTVASDRVTYAAPEGQIEFFTNSSTLPRLNGKSLDLNTSYTYSGPYLHSSFASDTITASYGGVQTVYDFAANTVTTSTTAPAALTFTIASGTTRTQLQEGYPVLWQDGTVTKTGSGTLVLDGANTFSGTTIVQSGTLLAANSAFARPGRGYVVGSGATLGLTDKWVRFGITGTTTVSGSGTLRVPLGTTLSSPGAAGHGDLALALGSGARIEVGGTLGAGFTAGRGSVLWGSNRADLSVEPTGRFDVQAAASVVVDALLGSGSITKSSAGATSLTIGIDNGSGTFSGSIASPTGTLTLVKRGSGSQTLAGASSYTGGTRIESGTLVAGHALALGGTSNPLAIQGGALNTGSFSLSLGTLSGSAGGLITTSSLVGTRILTTNVASGTGVFAGSIADNGSGRMALVKAGSGELVLAAANPYTGSTTVSGGVLRLAHPSALGSSSLVPLAGGTVRFAPAITSTLGGLVANAGGLIDVGNGFVTVSSGLSAADLVTALVAGRGDGTWNGVRGIMSSVAASGTAIAQLRGVGWLDNGDGSTSFAYAAAGDTNLDWSVDILDAANILASGKFNSGLRADWIDGDANYDAVLDILDVADMIGTELFNAGGYNGPAAALAVVPEPSLPAVVALAFGFMGVVLGTRRRRCRAKTMRRRASEVTWLAAAVAWLGAAGWAADVPPARVAARARLVTTAEEPVTIRREADGRLVLDFGKAMFAWLLVEFPQPPPAFVLGTRLGEKSDTGGGVDMNPGGSIASQEVVVAVPAGAKAVNIVPTWKPINANWIPCPDGMEEVAPFRYVELRGLPPGIEAPRAVRMSRHVPFDDQAASFACSDPSLVEVWELCKHSIKATSFAGLYIDGNRERIPYEADAFINQLCHYAVDAHYDTARLTLEHFLSHPTWPTEWRQHVPLMAWADWLSSGDDDFVRRHYDVLREMLMLDRRRPDGLFLGYVSGTPRDIVDWPRGERDGYDMSLSVKTVTTAFHARSLEAMAAIARGTGREADAKLFDTLRQATMEAMRRRLFDDGQGCFVDGLDPATDEVSHHASLHANMLPLAFGLVPATDVPRVAAHVAGRGMACSVYGAQYLLDGLFDARHDREGLAFLTATGDRGWLHMCHDLGSTITLEAWDSKYKPNLDWNHAWGAVPANVIARKLMGIEPLEPGFRRVRIRPRIANLKWATIRHPSPRGAIGLDVKNDTDSWQATLTLPDGVVAEVHVPGEIGSQVRATHGDDERLLSILRVEDGCCVVETQAGTTRLAVLRGDDLPRESHREPVATDAKSKH
jgi:autotransporter-associated beta strand protein